MSEKVKSEMWMWVAGGLLGLCSLMAGVLMGGATAAQVNAVQDADIRNIVRRLDSIETKVDRLLERP